MDVLKVLSLLVLVCLAQEGVSVDSITFHLYTRDNLLAPHEMKVGDEALLRQSKFDASKPTYVVIHGWRGSRIIPPVLKPKNALLAAFDCNVIAVDWRKIAASMLYPIVIRKVPQVGAHVAQFLKFLHAKGNLNLGKTHLIGHSLGGQVCGFAGKNLSGLGLARITGMDPAGPGFSAADPTKRLAATDANFVDCIITNAGKLGSATPICRVNYYVNGGKKQPGCGMDLTGACSHGRAVSLYAESVDRKNRFKAAKCTAVPDATGQGCVPTKYVMGEHASTAMEGIYYVKTRDKAPFALND